MEIEKRMLSSGKHTMPGRLLERVSGQEVHLAETDDHSLLACLTLYVGVMGVALQKRAHGGYAQPTRKFDTRNRGVHR